LTALAGEARARAGAKLRYQVGTQVPLLMRTMLIVQMCCFVYKETNGK